MKNSLFYALTMVLVLGQSNAMAAGAAKDGAYQLDPAHTNIGFEVSHMGISFVVGRFDKYTSDIKFTANKDLQIKLDIDASSVNTHVGQRDTHLRSQDFFNVAQFPRMTFVSKTVTYDAEGNPKTVDGDLTMHGQTKPITLTVSPIGTGDGSLGEYRAGFHATALLKRSAFGMTNLMAVAGDDITININVEAIKQ